MAGSTWPSWRAAATLTDIIADVKKAMPLNEVDEHMRGKCHFKKAGGQSGQCSAETGAGAGMCLILPPPLLSTYTLASNADITLWSSFIRFHFPANCKDLTNFQ